ACIAPPDGSVMVPCTVPAPPSSCARTTPTAIARTLRIRKIASRTRAVIAPRVCDVTQRVQDWRAKVDGWSNRTHERPREANEWNHVDGVRSNHLGLVYTR